MDHNDRTMEIEIEKILGSFTKDIERANEKNRLLGAIEEAKNIDIDDFVDALMEEYYKKDCVRKSVTISKTSMELVDTLVDLLGNSLTRGEVVSILVKLVKYSGLSDYRGSVVDFESLYEKEVYNLSQFINISRGNAPKEVLERSDRRVDRERAGTSISLDREAAEYIEEIYAKTGKGSFSAVLDELILSIFNKES